MTVKPIPEGYHAVTPYLFIKGAAQAIEFYAKAFGARELLRYEAPGGKIGHAEVQIGDSRVMLADEYPEMTALSPQTLGGTGGLLMLYVEDVDAVFQRAIQLGARQLQPVQDKFYGDRTGTLLDPFGHMWTIGTHKEDLTPEEMRKREAAMREKQG